MDSMAAGGFGLAQQTVLYAEDDPVIRTQVVYFLQGRVARLIEAVDGDEAWALYRAEAPDLVLTDIQMPGISGLALCQRIKAMSHETPVIITTAHNEAGFLQEAIACGVDGYVLKPVDFEQLMTVMTRTVRQLLDYRELVNSRAALLDYHRRAESERNLVAALMARMMRPDRLADPLASYWFQPAEVVGGDLLCLARSPHGKLHFMLADSTGHGLASTINLLPINYIFYSMVARNQTVPVMVEEMNAAIRDQSPTGRYVAAVIGALDERNRTIEVWNGGLPEVLFVTDDGHIAHRFVSENVPLGIASKGFSPLSSVYQWQIDGQLVVYSDGLTDVENELGVPFDDTGVAAVVAAHAPSDRLLAVQRAIRSYCGMRSMVDDAALLILNTRCAPGAAGA